MGFVFFMPKTFVIRHTKENRKKCSLTPLEERADFEFFTYPQCRGKLPDLKGAVLLDFDGPELSKEDANCKGIIILDGTWRYAKNMRQHLPELESCSVRRIPEGFVTAYPRKQTDCLEPEAGLASIEAIYIAYVMLGWDPSGLLDSYYWKDEFFVKNDFK